MTPDLALVLAALASLGAGAWGWRQWRRYRMRRALSNCPRIGRYRLQGVLGEGGMATVHWGVDEDGRPVAVKVLRAIPGQQPSTEDLKRFRREVAITARLSHPNIVRVLDFGDQAGATYLVMERVSGRSLREVDHPMPLPDFVPMFRAVVDAVWYAHRKGVIHRDLKPGNILLRPDGRPVVMDFGISRSDRHRTALTASGYLLGTPLYLAPEQIASGQHSPQSDQYSLGVTAFELLSGRTVVAAGDTMAVTYAKLVQATPSLADHRPDLPPRLLALVDRMLAFDPTARFPDLAPVLAELQAL